MHNLLFPTADGALMYPNNFPKRDFKAVLKRAGLPEDIRLYDLRHTCASLLLQADVHPKVVSERLGHANAYAGYVQSCAAEHAARGVGSAREATL